MAEISTGIVGLGWVGESMRDMFPESKVYDEPKKIGSRVLLNQCEVVFVCVPTPNNPDGSLDSSIVEDVVGWLESDLIVIRSTMQPGTADRLKKETGKRIVTQPEYLGESVAHPMLDQSERPFIILGGDKKDTRKVIETYQGVYNANTNIRQTTNLEAEVIKLSENRAIMYKVVQCQELYDACESAGVDYYTVRDAVYGDDPRFNLWFSFIFPNARGANSKCIPKDVKAWAAWAETSPLTDSMLKYNDGLIE